MRPTSARSIQGARRAQPRNPALHRGDVHAGHARSKAELLASLIEEEDLTASLGETLYQVARRVERQPFSAVGRELVNATLDQVTDAMGSIETYRERRSGPRIGARLPTLPALRERA